MRCSIRETGRTSPVNPISPARHKSLETERSKSDESTAAITAKSIAGSLTFNPPAIVNEIVF